MNIFELQTKLYEEGCNSSSYRIINSGGHSDVFCLDIRNGKWTVFYTERGDESSIFSSSSEDEACEYFYNYVMNIRHIHLIDMFKTEKDAEMFEQKLNDIGIKTVRNDIPCYNGPNDPLFRVFVEGKDIFQVPETLNKYKK